MRLKRSMIVAMTIMRMMEMPVNQIVHVISVRNCLMSTIRTMLMGRFMRTAIVCGSAAIWIHISDLNAVLLDLTILALMMEMAIVEIIGMTIMLNRSVSTVRAMLVVVILVQM